MRICDAFVSQRRPRAAPHSLTLTCCLPPVSEGCRRQPDLTQSVRLQRAKTTDLRLEGSAPTPDQRHQQSRSGWVRTRQFLVSNPARCFVLAPARPVSEGQCATLGVFSDEGRSWILSKMRLLSKIMGRRGARSPVAKGAISCCTEREHGRVATNAQAGHAGVRAPARESGDNSERSGGVLAASALDRSAFGLLRV